MDLAATPKPEGAAWNKAVALILLTGLVAYCNSFTKSFLLDDNPWIIGNMIPDDLFAYAAQMPNRWVIMVANWVNYQFAEWNPIGYHGFNLAVHLAAALALFGIVRRTLLLGGSGGWAAGRRAWPEYYRDNATGLALAVALIWVAHPLLTHAVTYIIQRCESMMGLFWLLTLYCLLRGATAERRAGLWYACAVGAAFLGVGCKEPMATAPFTVLAFDWVFLSGSFRELLRKRWWVHLGIAAAVWGFHGYTYGTAVLEAHDASVGFGSRTLPWNHYLMTEAWVILHYLRLAVWPTDLCFEYRDWPTTTALADFWPAGLALGSAFLASLWAALTRRWWGFVGLWFFFALAVSSSVLPILDVANEYRTYLALISVVVFAVLAGDWLLRLLLRGPARERLRPAAAGGLLAVVVALLVGRTLVRNEDYQSPYVMWTDVLAKRSPTAKVYNDAGVGAQAEGKTEEAIDFYRKALQLGKLPLTLNNLGYLLWWRGDEEEAYQCLREAVRLSPDASLGLANLSRMLLARGDTAEAVEKLSIAVRGAPQNARTRATFALALQRQGLANAAEAESARGPRAAWLWASGQLLAQMAAREYAAAARQAPELPGQFRQEAWAILFRQKHQGKLRFADALNHARMADQLAGGNDPDMLDLLAAAYAAAGESRQAVAVATRGRELARAANRHELVRVFDRRLQVYRNNGSVVPVKAADATS